MKEKKQLVVETVLNKMFEIAGHDIRYNDILGRTDKWYQQYTMSTAQNEEWKQWGIEYVAKQLRISKGLAKKEVDMIDFMWGLKIHNFQTNLK